MAATSGAFSSYDGWYNINMVAGEVINPQRNISKSLFIGLGACIVIYLLVNLAYLYVLPVGQMANSSLVAADACKSVWGVVSRSGGRADHHFRLSAPPRTTSSPMPGSSLPWGRTATSFAGPARSIRDTARRAMPMIVMGVWSMLFMLSGSFDILADMFVFMSWVFYGLTLSVSLSSCAAKMPDLPRPIPHGGYPWRPAFIIFTLFYLGTTIYNDITAYSSGKAPIINSVFGLLLTATGIPFIGIFSAKSGKHEKDSSLASCFWLAALLLSPGQSDHQRRPPDARHSRQTTAADSFFLLRPDRVFDGEQMHEGWQVLVHGRLIEAAGPQARSKRRRRTVILDLKGATLLPGLIEGHSHLFLHPYNEVSWNDQVLKESGPNAPRGQLVHARATLLAGFTTTRDLGTEGAMYDDVGLKQAIDKGVIPGPHILCATRAIVATGSYGPKELSYDVESPHGAAEADGVEGLRRKSRHADRQGSRPHQGLCRLPLGRLNGDRAEPTFTVEELKKGSRGRCQQRP
jgi:hypothetical protein